MLSWGRVHGLIRDGEGDGGDDDESEEGRGGEGRRKEWMDGWMDGSRTFTASWASEAYFWAVCWRMAGSGILKRVRRTRGGMAIDAMRCDGYDGFAGRMQDWVGAKWGFEIGGGEELSV